MWYESQGYSSPKQHVTSQQPIQPLVDQLVEPMQFLVNPTLPLEIDLHQVVESMPYSINPTLPLKSELYASNVLFISSLEPSRQGGTNFTSNEPPPIP